MTLILNEEGKLVNTTDESIDTLKRKSYKHSIAEKTDEDIESFVDSLEELEDGDEEASEPAGDLSEESLEIAMLYNEFRTTFTSAFGDAPELFDQLDSFFQEKGIGLNVGLEQIEVGADIPGMESSEQSIVTSEVEDK